MMSVPPLLCRHDNVLTPIKLMANQAQDQSNDLVEYNKI
jgi:hypothetical protein